MDELFSDDRSTLSLWKDNSSETETESIAPEEIELDFEFLRYIEDFQATIREEGTSEYLTLDKELIDSETIEIAQSEPEAEPTSSSEVTTPPPQKSVMGYKQRQKMTKKGRPQSCIPIFFKSVKVHDKMVSIPKIDSKWFEESFKISILALHANACSMIQEDNPPEFSNFLKDLIDEIEGTDMKQRPYYIIKSLVDKYNKCPFPNCKFKHDKRDSMIKHYMNSKHLAVVCPCPSPGCKRVEYRDIRYLRLHIVNKHLEGKGLVVTQYIPDKHKKTCEKKKESPPEIETRPQRKKKFCC